MNNILCILLLTVGTSFHAFCQNTALSPLNNKVKAASIKPETSTMNWFAIQGEQKAKIGVVQTDLQKEAGKLRVITTVKMVQAASAWVDTTVVDTLNFKPIYHSSYNQQRDMVLAFDEEVTGYYLDKQTNTKTIVSEKANGNFFDSNFYPQLIRFLPLKEGYQTTLSIFDFNPKAKTGIMTASIRNTEKINMDFHGKKQAVWKVETTDEISNNTVVNTYYICMDNRKILKQEIDFGGRKMLMELVEK